MKNIEPTKPKYIQIMEYLMEQIKNGELKPGDQIPTENELMDAFSVSRIVIINSLSRLATEGIIERFPGKGSFVKSADGVSFNEQSKEKNPHHENDRIELIIPGIDARHTICMARNLSSLITQKDKVLSISYSYNEIAYEEKLIDYIEKQNPAGLIIFPVNQEAYNKKILDLANKGFPIVLIDRDLPGLGLNCVQTDNNAVTEMATSYLIKHGHKNICVCSQTRMPTMSISNRIDGFISEMKKNNLMINPSLLLTNLGQTDSIDSLVEIVKNGAATAVICLTLFDYHLVHKTFQEHGIRCPEDISMISVDDPELYDYRNFSATCVVQDTATIAQETVDLLFAQLNGSTKVKKVLVPPIFMEGNTVATLK